MGLFGSFLSKFSRNRASIEDIEEFRKLLIESDLGVGATEEIIDLVKKEKSENLENAVAQRIKSFLSDKPREISLHHGEVTTVLIVGVNGTGKTTSAAKLANFYKTQGKKILLVAADTFRAAAVDQLVTWGSRIGVDVVKGSDNSDPAAVCFDGASKAKNENYDLLIIDTAGRLHTKSNLMEELSKVRRVIEKVTPVNEVLFVLDGTTGQNGIEQAKVFHEAIGISGIVVTKLDGSAGGGIALAVERDLQVPVKLFGFGEGVADISEFDPDRYLRNLFT